MVETKVNADFSERIAIDTNSLPWIPSPMAGVERRMLDRIGGEVARATSIVRYAPDSAFSPHSHALGEEFLVLEGVFQDEHGDFGPGCYVRNPPGSRHTPASAAGCVIFVKLRQMRDDGSEPALTVDTSAGAWAPAGPTGYEHQVLFTHADGREFVALERLAPATHVPPRNLSGGEEILVLEGTLLQLGERYPAGCWIRNPAGAKLDLGAGPKQGCLFWVKRGHLPAIATNALDQ
jgi:anti-sigma factor ChrR (cupin superfamily)